MQGALADLNVWLALTWRNHAFHEMAREWFYASEAPCCFCRVTQMGLLRLMTNRKILAEEVLTQEQAWGAYRRLLGDPQIVFLEEPGGLDVRWQTLSSRSSPSTKRWTDDYLAAFAMTAELRLVTFDRGFSTYEGLQFEIPVRE
jgi:toxin-antitoxin system PIN domain toxin